MKIIFSARMNFKRFLTNLNNILYFQITPFYNASTMLELKVKDQVVKVFPLEVKDFNFVIDLPDSVEILSYIPSPNRFDLEIRLLEFDLKCPFKTVLIKMKWINPIKYFIQNASIALAIIVLIYACIICTYIITVRRRPI